jgi:hypothetical protein
MAKVDEYVRRTYRYFYDDGLVEIGIGLLMVVVGSVLFSWPSVNSLATRTIILSVALPALALGGAAMIRRLIRKAKEQVTYKRTGYASFRQGEPAGSRWFPLLAALILFGIVFFLPETFMRMHFAVAYFSAASLLYLGYRLELRRFFAVGAATFLIGVAVTITVANETAGTGLALGGAGLLLLLSGVLTLIRYLRQHPQPRNEQA